MEYLVDSDNSFSDYTDRIPTEGSKKPFRQVKKNTPHKNGWSSRSEIIVECQKERQARIEIYRKRNEEIENGRCGISSTTKSIFDD